MSSSLASPIGWGSTLRPHLCPPNPPPLRPHPRLSSHFPVCQPSFSFLSGRAESFCLVANVSECSPAALHSLRTRYPRCPVPFPRLVARLAPQSKVESVFRLPVPRLPQGSLPFVSPSVGPKNRSARLLVLLGSENVARLYAPPLPSTWEMSPPETYVGTPYSLLPLLT